MEAKDILLAPEPLEARVIGSGPATILYAENHREGLRFHFEAIGGHGFVTLPCFQYHSPTLQAFIEKARQHFAPKRSCGELTREDLESLCVCVEAKRAWGIIEWATARNIQLPEAP